MKSGKSLHFRAFLDAGQATGLTFWAALSADKLSVNVSSITECGSVTSARTIGAGS
jgi:hypothetical protein